MTNKTAHTFHIPVMGTGYTVNTPLRVAQYGISSVVSIIDDVLLENLRNFYSKQMDLPFQPISSKTMDCRAERITAYLNLMDKMVKSKFEEVKDSFIEKGKEFEKYMDLLPDVSTLKKEIQDKVKSNNYLNDIKGWLNDNLPLGNIDVNIMTKVDKENCFEGEQLPSEYNDAHAALRGYANSTLESSLVLSAGMNPRLYGYLEQFNDFYPNKDGYIKKKITLKVSDYRSALIQGKFLAKKGIWVSEYRIESGLNCGGHAFATDGSLMGPILEEFKNNKSDLIADTSELLYAALQTKNRPVPEGKLDLRITAQGGVGTSEEHDFLLNYYGINSVGWGSPFLLVPEVCDVDETTFKTLSNAKEEDLYLSHSSPLGVRFYSLKGNTRDKMEKEELKNGKPGSICTKRLLVSNKDYTENTICTASRQYQNLKIKDLQSQNLSQEAYDLEIEKMSRKTCLCKGLSASSYLVNGLDTSADGDGVSICPGPNMAYFSETATLKQMVDHIYGRFNLIKRSDRPNMFVKELSIYINYLKEEISELKDPDKKCLRNLEKFKKKLLSGIEYYNSLSEKINGKYDQIIDGIQKDMYKLESELNQINILS
ncbi:hypothetical protein [Ancylomarina sp. 16SWW S1-10-2]|uniref:hypothetical protein n=1 Tax=Ancylomarina sp. 16SWW S1-10-2 TaxID=2499681 RepID=UPI0012ADA6FF|nr:hypothetical protein [Ancylomarina sp. 16SWW S1-10-2]MRT93559.1 hypothetical protein [Ancylomarina sp. 16SWW S1-10-2]